MTGRPAPWPLSGRGTVTPAFDEWFMGFPEGWVDGMKRSAALKALGNAVVPLVATAAFRMLVCPVE